MKKLLLIMAVLLSSIAFISCNNDDEKEKMEAEITVLQDSLNVAIEQHNALIDSVNFIIETLTMDEDINALKIKQIVSLFEAIARQPEASSQLIDATEMLYSDYTALLPFSDKTIEQRGVATAALFDAIARQPEAYGKLDTAATKFLGAFNTANMSDDYTEGFARGTALSGLFAALARQPEAYGKIDSLATKFIGEYNASNMSSDLISVSKAYAMTGLNESIARQPEADSLFNLVTTKFLNFTFINE